jgi:hypothetical protein
MLKENGDSHLNLVRNKAGITAIEHTSVKGLKNERKDELTEEFADRSFDLDCWRNAKEVYHKALYVRIHAEGSSPNASYKVKERWPARNFDVFYMHSECHINP